MTLGYLKTKKSLGKLQTFNEKDHKENLFNRVLHKFDLFGQNVQFNIDGKNDEIRTGFGGVVSIGFWVIISIYFQALLQKLIRGDETIFMSSAKYYDTDKDDRNLTYFENYKVGTNSSSDHITTYSMGEFEDSFNIFVGTANESNRLI